MSKKKFTVSIKTDTYRALNVYAAQNDLRLGDLAQQVFEEFVIKHAQENNSNVS